MDPYYKSTRRAYHLSQFIWYLLGILEALLAFRFLLKLFRGNIEAPFTKFIYTWTEPLTSPFATVFSTSRVENSAFEWTTLLAMGVYWLIAYGITRLFMLFRTIVHNEEETPQNPNQQQNMGQPQQPNQNYQQPTQQPGMRLWAGNYKL